MTAAVYDVVRRAVLALAVAAGPASPSPAPAVAPVVFTAKTTAISVQPGQIFLISLDSNATTGYAWSAMPGYAPAVIEVLGSSYRTPDSMLLGAGGTQIFVVRALAPGTTTLVLGYARSFEPGVAPAQSATFAISVR